MDFELDEAQQVIAASAAEVLAKAAGGGDAAGGRDRAGGGDAAGGGDGAGGGDAAGGGDGASGRQSAAWQGLADAGLLGLTLPEWLGGDGLGVVEAGVVLTEVGRHAADVPALATIMLGALPVVRRGSRDLQERLLAGALSGGAAARPAGSLGPALSGSAAARPTRSLGPALTAGVRGHAAADADTVTGTLVGVPCAADADWILVPAGEDVVVVAADAVTLTRTPASWAEYTVRMDGAPVAGVLPGAAGDLHQLAAAGAVAMADGAVAGALDLTARHVATREQFGRPLATFQAVAQQIADVYIVSRTLHLAALSACWRLATGRDAAEDCEVAAYWLATEAPAALRTCHHLHGGLGMDISYPLHRYSAMITDLARFVGGAEYRLERLAPCSST